ncbi:MAG: EAL domain-containing protein [Gammaproteobacteria bacterium]|nr:EAL domain-containing protein [Gammaproteobacteria bacterium]
MDSDTVLRLLIVENSRNEAQGYIKALRNAGIAVRAEVAEDDEDVEAFLDKQRFDMVLTVDALEETPLARIFEVVRARDADLPVVVATGDYDEQHALSALRQGASNIVSKHSAEHLQTVIRREATQLMQRRELASARVLLDETDRRCQELLASSRDAIAYAHEGMHIYANPAYLELFGFEGFGDLEGVPLMDMVVPDDQTRLKEFLRAFSRGETDEHELELTGLLPDGAQFSARMLFAPANYDGEPCTQITIREEADDAELQAKLQALTKQDTVTGLLNRTAFLEALDVRLVQPESGPLHLLYIAIDDFKSVKEQVGFAAMDAVLRAFADLIRELAGEDALLARLSDQAFAVLLETGDLDAAAEFGERLRASVADKLFEVDDQAVSMTCSLGLSPVEPGDKAHVVVAQADLACESAQGAGGNRLQRHNAVSYARATQQRDQVMVEMIKEAGNQGRFRLFYQPIVGLTGGGEENYEVFLRMFDEEGEVISPAQFLPAAEQSGQIAQIERWVIANVIHILAKRHKSGRGTRLFINLSETTLSDTELVGWLAERLEKYQLPSEALVFEIDEEAIANHIGDARSFCEALHGVGCLIAIDHFGSTSNSFQLLGHVPASFLKLDRSFATAMDSGTTGQEKIRQVTEKAHETERKVIAEFVEDARHLNTLWQCQIDYIQGFFLQEPSPGMTFDFQGESM